MPYMGYYGIDMYYIVLVLPCVLFAFWAQSQVNGTFNRYSRVMSRRGLTGAQAAQAVLRANGVSGVNIEYVAGKLTDHFDPRTNTIRLSASRFEVKARHRDLFPGDEPPKVVRQPCKIHALRTFEIGYPVLVIHRLLIVGRRAVIVIHREHVRVHAGWTALRTHSRDGSQ